MNRRQVLALLPAAALLPAVTEPGPLLKGLVGYWDYPSGYRPASTFVSSAIAMVSVAAATLQPLFRRPPNNGVVEHWYESAFYLTDKELAAGAIYSPSFREAVKAMGSYAQYKGINWCMGSRDVDPDPRTALPITVQRGNAIVRITAERQYGRVLWALDIRGGR